MSIVGWDFEDVDTGGGWVSSWSLAGEFADHGVLALGWPDGSPGVFMGRCDSPWSGGNVLPSPSVVAALMFALCLMRACRC